MITLLAAVAQDVAELSVDSPAFVAIRFSRYLGMLALIGAIAFALAVVPRVRSRNPEFARAVLARTLGLAHWGAWILLASCVLRLAAQLISIGGTEAVEDFAMFKAVVMRTAWGHAWLLEFGATLGALWGLARVARRGNGGMGERGSGGTGARGNGGTGERGNGGTGVVSAWAIPAIAAPLLAVGAALSGHAVALESGAWKTIILDAIHVLAASGWAGGLATLVIAGISVAMRSASGTSSTSALAALARAFSPVALISAAILAVTGAGSAWFQMGSVSALWTTGYGRTLLVKLSILAVMAAIGAYNWRRVLPSLESPAGAPRLQKSARTELAFAVAIILVTAVLVATPTPMEHAH